MNNKIYKFHLAKKRKKEKRNIQTKNGLKFMAVPILIMCIEDTEGQNLCSCITKEGCAPFPHYTLSGKLLVKLPFFMFYFEPVGTHYFLFI